MINAQLLELSMSRTNLHGPNDVRAIGVLLDMNISIFTLSCRTDSVGERTVVHVNEMVSVGNSRSVESSRMRGIPDHQ